ncbi:unnamed protein product [marine sediment metagenome]|uniref:Uncharacterized protein n=1 Tax=marine sediment metagenome TaxID=412755 RepID=X1BDU6_9ZZZZ
MDILTQKVKAFALSKGADLVGVAPVERWKKAPLELSPQGLMPGSKSVFVVGIPDSAFLYPLCLFFIHNTKLNFSIEINTEN